MKLVKLVLPLGILLSLCSAIAPQCSDETACRSAASIYSADSWGFGTATGYASDHVILRNKNGGVIADRTVAQWETNQKVNGIDVVDGVVHHSGGQTSIRFWYGGVLISYPGLSGGTVEVVRSGCLVDRDRLW